MRIIQGGHMKRLLVFIVLVLISTITAGAVVDKNTCKPFYQALFAVPHESIFQREGFFNSQYFGTSAKGCFVVMNTDDNRLGNHPLPDFSAAPGSDLHQAGWQTNPKYSADGAGTGVTGLERDDALCMVYYERPSYYNDDGTFVQDFHIKFKVECMEGAAGKSPKMILKEAKG
jgi:hypothetical protein